MQLVANIRFSNRIMAREIANAKQDQGNKLRKEIFQRAWGYNTKYQALERQALDTTGGRVDLIPNLDNYEKIYQEIKDKIGKINKVKGNKVGDRAFAKWLRQVVQGEDLTTMLNIEEKSIIINPGLKNELLKFLTNLAQLLFGTEVARNPSSLILQHIALDLIIAGKSLTWRDALAKPAFKEHFGGARFQ